MELGFDKIGKGRIIEELRTFYNFMKEINVEDYFLVGGLLLFFHRDKKLQEYDKDFDFRVTGDETLYHILEKVKEHGYYDEAHIVGLENAKILWIMKHFDDHKYVLPIEISAQYVKGDNVFFNREMWSNPDNVTWKYKEGRLVWPKKLFDSFAKVEFEGMSFNAPNPIDEWLRVFYGNDWRTPKEWADWRYNCANLFKGYW